MLVLLNIILYFVSTLAFKTWPSDELRAQLNEDSFRRSVVEMYVQTLDPIDRAKLPADPNEIFLMGLKDQKFWLRAEAYPFVGDVVQIAATRAIIKEFRETYLQSAQHQFGLSSYEISPWAWLTYQFVHASLLHLLSNLLVIFMVLSFLEKSVNETWLGAVYLLSGFAGGVSFLYFDTAGSMAVIGASAAASGLLSFLLVTHSNRTMPWGYMIAPVVGGYGQIFLPVFFVFPVFLVSDFSTLLWEPSGINANVAVSAHVGGCLMGLSIGVVYLLFLRSKAASHRILGHHYGLHELS